MRSQQRNIATLAVLLCTASSASAQWVIYTNQTGTRLPTGAGLNDPAVTTADPEEKRFVWGDVDQDGDLDVFVTRKVPFSNPGGRRAVLLMNEGGVLMDRTSTKGVDSLGVPAIEGVSQGMLDACNTRQAVFVDVNNDGWLDIVTAPTIADVNGDGSANMLPRYIGHPRVYINKGEVAGVWQGFRYEYARIPQLVSTSAVNTNPRFCSVAAGDINGDGYVDLYFSDYDNGEVGPAEPANHDVENVLMMNQGLANPGFFTNESSTRLNAAMPAGGGNLAHSFFGAHGQIADMNGDGIKDVICDKTLGAPIHNAVMINPGTGMFTTASYHTLPTPNDPYGINVADLNGDGKLDLVSASDGTDRYLLNPGDGFSFTSFTLTSLIATESDFNSFPCIADLNNDGWPDIIMPDEDLDTNYYSRRTRIYHNQGNAPNVTIKEETTPVIPLSNLTTVYQAATFDINGDGWRDLILGRASGDEVWMNSPAPSLTITYPSGLPASLTPNAATNFNVQLTGANGGNPFAGSGKIFMSVNGAAFTQTSMTPLGGNLYQATIPAQPCGTSIRYYFSGQLSTGPVFTDPPTLPLQPAPSSYYLVAAYNSTQVALSDDFETNTGVWTVQNGGSLTGGAWERATPVGTWNEGIKAAPGAANSGSFAFVTQNGSAGGALGAADVDGGPTDLISPTFDLTGSNATVSFARWFYSSTPGIPNNPGDVLQVAVSNNNGGSWIVVSNYLSPVVPIFNNGNGEIQQTKWIPTTFNVGDYITPTSQVKIRFEVNDIAPAGIVEAGIDDFVITKFICQVPCIGDTNGSGAVDIDDLVMVITSWNATSGPADLNHDNIVNIDDLVTVITHWGACP